MNEENGLLLGCLRREEESDKLNRLQDYTLRDWEMVLQAARQYGLMPLLFQTLKALDAELDIDGAVWQKMRSVYYVSAARNMRLYHELLNILAALNSRGIAVIILKGAHLAESVYGNIALRPMGDVDLLARSEDLFRVHQVLIEKGYSSADGEVSCHLHLAPYNKKGGLNIDVHHSITRPPVARRFEVAALWGRAKKDSYQGVNVLTLGPEDLVLHLSTHTCIDHCFDNGLIPYFDLLHTVERYKGELSWYRMWERANEWGMERAVYLMLALTEKMLGLPMPEEIKDKISPDRQTLFHINSAESLIFEKSGGVSPMVARMFGKQGWRTKLNYFFGRTFPPKEMMSVAFQGPNGKKKNLRLYWLYLIRVQTLLKKHGKMIWSGLRRGPQVITALHMETSKNTLRDWLTNSEQ